MKNIILFVKQKTTRKSGCWWKTQDFEPEHIKTHTKSVVRFLFALIIILTVLFSCVEFLVYLFYR